MKLDRRNFIQFSVGATAGFLLTPVNWKLMDDAAIWTQNWSWVSTVDAGEAAYATTTCQFCNGGCGIKIRLIDGQRAVKVEGNPLSPINRGGLCSWGAAGLQYQYMEENRVTGPMIRDELTSAWRPISWEKGLELLAEKLAESADSPDEVALLTGRKRSSMNSLFRQFMAAYGSANYLETPDGGDSQMLASERVFGGQVRYGYDLERADVILSFGAALLEGWGSPVRMQRAFQGWRGYPTDSRATLIQVEAQSSMTASKADMMLAAKPGTEAVLALGVAKAMIDAGAVSAKASSAPGYRAFKSLVADYSAEHVEEITGVSGDRLVAAAKAFATAKRSVALSGLGQGARPEPFSLAWAVLCLNLLKGNMGQPGGVFLTPDLPLASLPQVDAPHGHRADGREDGAADLAAFAEHVLEHKAKLKTLLVFEANPVFAGPNPVEAQEALAEIPFRVSFSSFWDETTQACNLVLPNAAPLERWDDVETPLGLPYMTLSVVKPLFGSKYDTKATGDVLLELAAGIGGPLAEALPFESHEEMIASRVAALQALGFGRAAVDDPPAANEMLAGGPGKGFGSADDALEAVAESGMWYLSAGAVAESFTFADGPQTAEEEQDDEDAYPLGLVAYESFRLTSGFYANPPFVTKILDDDFLLKGDVFVNINPATADDAGLAEGERAVLKTAHASAKVRVHLTEGAMPDTVFVPLGLGHTSFDPTIKGVGINGAALFEAEPDPAGGYPLMGLGRVKIEKA